jgi:8-oxo-dGTP pyrophosphatase MutT (NUDIX family)
MAGRPGKKIIIVAYQGKGLSRRYWLVTSSQDPGKWLHVKGSVESDMSNAEVSIEECYEEAGLKMRKGTLRKVKSKQGFVTPDGSKLYVFSAEVKHVLPDRKWVERKKRKRRKFTYSQAMRILRKTSGKWRGTMSRALRLVQTS